MIAVWILVFYVSGTGNGGPAVIDNIASQEECVRIQKIVNKMGGASSRCIEVRKVKQ